MTNTTVNNVTVTNVYNNSRNVNVNNVNVNNRVTNVNKITYVNQRAPGAVTAVSRETFVNARPVGPVAVRMTGAQLRNVHVMPGVSVAPARKSVLAAPPVQVARPPAVVVGRKVVTRLDPAPTQVPFTRRQPMLVNRPGRPLAPAQVQALHKPQERQERVVFSPPVRAKDDTYHIHRPERPQQSEVRRPEAERPAGHSNVPETHGGTGAAHSNVPDGRGNSGVHANAPEARGNSGSQRSNNAPADKGNQGHPKQ